MFKYELGTAGVVYTKKKRLSFSVHHCFKYLA